MQCCNRMRGCRLPVGARARARASVVVSAVDTRSDGRSNALVGAQCPLAMSHTLADSFLADLDELDDEPMALEAPGAAGGASGAAELAAALAHAPPTGSVDTVAPLMNSERYARIMEVRSLRACCPQPLRYHSPLLLLNSRAPQKVQAALAREGPARTRVGPLEDDPEYQVRAALNGAQPPPDPLSRSSSWTATR